ncbi:MAG: hypothetical protein R3C58_10220 [Parvularculaceae bacterium]
MSDRLKQIWSGFSQTTTRHLTGRGVENILVPHRSDYTAADESFLPADFNAPAQAAFAALKENLGKKEKMFAGRRKGKAAAALPSEAEDFVAATAFSHLATISFAGFAPHALRVDGGDRLRRVLANENRRFIKAQAQKFFGLFWGSTLFR